MSSSSAAGRWPWPSWPSSRSCSASTAIVDAAGSAGLTVAAVVLAARAILLPALLVVLISRTREARRLTSEGHLVPRLALAVTVVVAVAVLVVPFGLESRAAEQASVALVALGIVIGATRRPVVFQALAFLVAENGIYLATLSLPGELPGLVEIGVLFDLVVIVSVAGAFGARIHQALGTGDTSLLSDLRD